MYITTCKVKQYNSTAKNVIMVDGAPICIVRGNKTKSKIISYLQGYNVDIADGKIKKLLDKYKKKGES